MKYTIENLGDRFFIYDDAGRFVCSADNYREALEEVEELEKTYQPKELTKYNVQYFRAKSRWITKNGQRLQVPVEEFSHYTKVIIASSSNEAISFIKKPGFIYTNIRVV